MTWGYSSAGRAPALQAGGRRFDPDYLHQYRIEDGWKRTRDCTFRSGFNRRLEPSGSDSRHKPAKAFVTRRGDTAKRMRRAACGAASDAELVLTTLHLEN